MQNKPNLPDTQINASHVKTVNYEQKTMNYEPTKQTQSKPTCGEPVEPSKPIQKQQAAGLNFKGRHYQQSSDKAKLHFSQLAARAEADRKLELINLLLSCAIYRRGWGRAHACNASMDWIPRQALRDIFCDSLSAWDFSVSRLLRSTLLEERCEQLDRQRQEDHRAALGGDFTHGLQEA